MNALRKSGLIIIFLLMILVPYVIASVSAGQDYVFGGFLLNPSDGNSYLAKMYQGWTGSWVFHLPFTAEPGNGVYLFLFYLFLGHLARWMGLSLLFTFHLARMMGGLFLLFCLYRFFGVVFERTASRNWALVLAVFGLGSGWLALPFGAMTSDLWVAEAFPFLSSLVNPHFPFALGLMLLLLIAADDHPTLVTVIRDVTLTMILAALQPFGVVILVLVLGGELIWDWIETRRFAFWRLVWIAVGGGPMLFYQFWVVRTNPVLANWNAQNLTPSPPVWDVLISFSPVIILAVLGGIVVYQAGLRRGRLALLWAFLGLVLLYVPFSLQRRFMLGLAIPLVVLAVYAMEYLQNRWSHRLGWLPGLVLGLTLPTTLVLMMVAGFGILGRNPAYYLKSTEVQAFTWIQANTPEHALVLASPYIGQLLPGWTGRRVIYGHPFETVNAEEEKKIVEAFFFDRMSQQGVDQLLVEKHIDYIFWARGDYDNGGGAGSLTIAYQNKDVTIYQVGREP